MRHTNQRFSVIHYVAHLNHIVYNINKPHFTTMLVVTSHASFLFVYRKCVFTLHVFRWVHTRMIGWTWKTQTQKSVRFRWGHYQSAGEMRIRKDLLLQIAIKQLYVSSEQLIGHSKLLLKLYGKSRLHKVHSDTCLKTSFLSKTNPSVPNRHKLCKIWLKK